MKKLEQTVIRESFAKLSLLQKMVLEPATDIERADILALFSSLEGLTQLREVESSGLSKEGEDELSRIDTKALHLMRIKNGQY